MLLSRVIGHAGDLLVHARPCMEGLVSFLQPVQPNSWDGSLASELRDTKLHWLSWVGESWKEVSGFPNSTRGFGTQTLSLVNYVVRRNTLAP